MNPDRIPCINPSCRRTAPADRYDRGTEIICGKCYRALPADDRAFLRRCWSEIRKWERRIARTADEIKRQRMKTIRNKWGWRLNYHWDTVIKAGFLNPSKPDGLDAFLEENGLV